MSSQLVSHSPDLRRLQEEGYDFEIRADQLVVRVPYATAESTVAVGFLVSELTMAGDSTTTPGTHVVHFVGATEGALPCDNGGRPLDELINSRGQFPLGDGLVASCS